MKLCDARPALRPESTLAGGRKQNADCQAIIEIRPVPENPDAGPSGGGASGTVRIAGSGDNTQCVPVPVRAGVVGGIRRLVCGVGGLAGSEGRYGDDG